MGAYIESVCGIRPRCDICEQHPEDAPEPPDDWNGETGNHKSCERVHRAYIIANDPEAAREMGWAA